MEKMMNMLLMLVILGFIMPESQAIKCYSCTGTSSCDDPFTTTGSRTCTGSICSKGKHVINGQLTIYFVSLIRPLVVSRGGLKFTHELSFSFFLFYQSTLLISRAVDGHQMYFTGSDVGKASTIGIGISPTLS